MNNLNESPSLLPIDNSLFDDEMGNEMTLASYLESAKKISSFEGKDIYCYGGFTYFMYEDNLMTFAVIFASIDIPHVGNKIPYQSAVWKNKSLAKSPSKIIFDKVFSERGIIASDNNHSPDGKKLWEKIISNVNNDSRFAYVTDLRNFPIRIYSVADMQKYYPDTKYRFILSSKELKSVTESVVRILDQNE